MLNTLIKERAEEASYSPSELTNISDSLICLKDAVNNQPDFTDPYIGGSFQRGTLVKQVSDVDIFYRYTGEEDPKSTLVRLRACIGNKFPKCFIKHNQPALAVTIDTIPFKITLFKKDESGRLSVSDDFQLNWRMVNMTRLSESVANLGRRSDKFFDLIKILKIWNFNYQTGIMNGCIEQRVCKLFLDPKAGKIEDDLPEMMWMFFNNNRFQPIANKVFSLMVKKGNADMLKRDWLRFIENE